MFVIDGDFQVVSDCFFENYVQYMVWTIRFGIVPPGHSQGVNQGSVHLPHMFFNNGGIPGIVGAYLLEPSLIAQTAPVSFHTLFQFF